MVKRFDPSLIPAFPTLEYERALRQKGLTCIAGLDEAGRGALAGPLCAASVVLPLDQEDLARKLIGVRDSKQMKPFDRQRWAVIIRETALDHSIGWVEANEIDALGMSKAGRLVFTRALQGLKCSPQHLLLDYFRLPELKTPQTALVKGDQRSLSIACASVLAKTARDDLMNELELRHPGYNFSQNKGYGTEDHIQALKNQGMSEIHRRNFCLDLIQPTLFD